MDGAVFTLSAEAFAVVGLTDVVIRSVAGLISFAGRIKAASATIRGLLLALRGLGNAIGEVRLWATTSEHSALATSDGRRPADVVTAVLQDCRKEIVGLKQLLLSLQSPSSGGFSAWMNKAKFAREEQDIRQSMGMLSHYASAMSLIITSRTGIETALVREGQAAAATVLSNIETGISNVSTASQEILGRIDTNAAFVKETLTDMVGQIASITLTETSDNHILAEGDNLDSAISALKAVNMSVARVLDGLGNRSSAIITQSNSDWFTAEIGKMLHFSYQSAAATAFQPARKAGCGTLSGLSFDVRQNLGTVPVYASAGYRDRNGALTVEYVQGTDALGRKVRRFRFACFNMGFAGSGSGTVGLVSRTGEGPLGPGRPPQISRQLRVLNVRPRSAQVFQLAAQNDVAGLQQLLSTGEASVLDYDENGFSVLAHAVIHLQVDAATLLLEAGSDPAVCRIDRLGVLDLHEMLWPAQSRHFQAFRARHFWLRRPMAFKRALHLSSLAFSKGLPLNPKLVEEHIRRGWYSWDLNDGDMAMEQFERTWAHQITREAWITVSEPMLEKPTVMLAMMRELDLRGSLQRLRTAVDSKGRTALHYFYQPRRLLGLLRAAAEGAMNKDDWRAVYRSGYASFVDQDYNGTSRQDAIADMIRLILQQGVDVNARCASGSTALMNACPGMGTEGVYSMGQLAAVSVLLKHRAVVDTRIPDGRTPLIAIMDWFQEARVARRRWINVYWPTTSGNSYEETTPDRYFEAFAGKLLAAGANPHEADREGRTALGIAHAAGRDDMAAFIESRALAAELKAANLKLDASELMEEFGWAFGER